MDIELIKDEADYRQALREIESLMDAEYGTPEGDRLDRWVRLVQAYEAIHYSLESPDSLEPVRCGMDWRESHAVIAERVESRFHKI